MVYADMSASEKRVARHVGGPRHETFAPDGGGDDGRVQTRRRVRVRALSHAERRVALGDDVGTK
jgi:hypothetical protein